MDWIKVEQELPEPHYVVLVYTTHGSIDIRYRRDEEEGGPKNIWSGRETDEITHWMPLPPPPEEDEDRLYL